MTRQTITTEHGTYLVAAETGRATVYVWTEPGQAAVHALSDIWTEIGTVRKEHVPALRTAKVSNGHDVWQPLGSAAPRSGQPRDFGGRSIKLARAGTRKAAVAEVISWYERPLKRAAAEQAMEAELAETVAPPEAEKTDVITLTPTTYTATCGQIAEQLVFKGRPYIVGYIAEGDTGRKVFGGEMVPGPWAFGSLAPTVISAHRDPSPQPSVEVAEGDLVAIAGTVYRVRDRSTGPERYNCGDHHLALDNA